MRTLGLMMSRRWIFASTLATVGLSGACGPADEPDGGADETGASAASETGSEPTASTTASDEADTGTAGNGSTGGTGGTGLGGACEGALADSFDAWQAARDGAGGTYTFTIVDQIVIADYCTSETYLACDTVTTLEVSGGEVVARSFTSAPAEDTPAEDCPAAYEETATDLGTHADGHPVETIDDVYTECCDLVQMQGGYHTSYEGDYEPDDVVVTVGGDAFLERCTAQYCDDCGCSGGPTFSVGSITLGG
jgi:hypothetical protein